VANKHYLSGWGKLHPQMEGKMAIGKSKMMTIKALRHFAGADPGRNGKVVSMSIDDIKEVSKEFADDVIKAGHAIEVAKKKKKKVKDSGSDNNS